MRRLFKILLCTLFFLVLSIISKSNNEYRDIIHYYLYEDSFNFNSIYSFYNKYLGGVSFYNNKKSDSIMVFRDEIKYSNIIKYNDGFKLVVGNNYVVPSISDGIVTYMGIKDNYGFVVIIKMNNNINVWYGNICSTDLKMYDYVENGDFIGENCNDYIYLMYEKDGIFLE